VDKPGLWSGAVIISANPGLSSGHAERLAADVAWAERFANDPWDKVLADWNRQGVLSNSSGTSRQEEEFDRSALAESLRTWSLGKQKNLQPAIEALTLPILWVVGEQDPKFCAIAQRLNLNEVSRVEVVAQAGHRVLFDQPERLRELLELQGRRCVSHKESLLN
jgi:2-succinyl-6-hydroxy-2,4-cyclohexadiene-1-carboxylate synthase